MDCWVLGADGTDEESLTERGRSEWSSNVRYGGEGVGGSS